MGIAQPRRATLESSWLTTSQRPHPSRPRRPRNRTSPLRCCLCPQCARTPTPHPSTRTPVPGEESLAEAAGARLARERDPVSVRYFVAEISTTLLGGET